MKRTRSNVSHGTTSESSDSEDSIDFECSDENDISEQNIVYENEIRASSPVNSNISLQNRLLQNAKDKIWEETEDFEPTIHPFKEENCGVQINASSVLDAFKAFFY